MLCVFKLENICSLFLFYFYTLSRDKYAKLLLLTSGIQYLLKFIWLIFDVCFFKLFHKLVRLAWVPK